MVLFNVRVYGILINEKKQILLTDELIRGNRYTKFPGGGLEFGEGTRECLEREFLEEMNLKVAVGDHLYTTDFFQISAFNAEHQIISVYYYVKALEPISVRLSERPFDFDDQQMATYKIENETESFRFVEWKDLDETQVSLPIDKVVVQLIKKSTTQL
ncbi:MAG: hypothetical protein NVS1B13_10570 [Flavisolibacter sp.]